MPGIAGLPGFLWRKLPRAGKVAVALVVVAALVAVVLSIPGIRAGKEGNRVREAGEAARGRRDRVARLRRLVEPRTLTVASLDRPSDPDATRAAARTRTLARVRAEIVADARSRESSRVKAARCERIPAGEPAPATDLAATEVGLSCVAVTSELDANERTTGVTIGYPYRALVDFRTGRVGFCRTVGQPGEGSYRGLPEVSTPAACGGG